MRQAGAWSGAPLANDGRTVKSAERTLAMFELFALYQRPMGVGEISRMLGIPQPSVSMLVGRLSALGYVERDPETRRYAPTARIMLLGSWLGRRYDGLAYLDAAVRDLVAEFSESAFVAVANGLASQYVLVRLAAHPERLEVQSGLLRPITRTAVGRALLSLRPDKAVLAVVRSCNAHVTDARFRVSPTAFMADVRAVRALGYARTDSLILPGQGSFAIAFSPSPQLSPIAIGIGGRSERLNLDSDRIIAALLRLRERHGLPPTGLLAHPADP